MIFLYIALGLLVIIFGLAAFISTSVFKPKKWEITESYNCEIENKRFNPEFYEKYNIEDVYIDSFGLKLHAHLINQNSDKTIIFMHGHTFTLFGSYKYAQMFLKKGYNVLMPDQRYHGASEGKNCTLGYQEAKDLNNWIDYVKTIFPNNQILGIHGESMGAATVLLGGHNKAVSFVISDCSFSDLKTQTTDILWKNFKIPKFIVYPTDLASRILYKAPLLKIKPMSNIENIKAPILFVHGDSDKYIGLDHLARNQLYKKDIDKVYVCKGADHAQSFATDRIEYENQVNDFLDGIGL